MTLCIEDKKDEITQLLYDIEKEFDVKILFAIESGSRSWGFASEDSDYDVRFIYVHRSDWYVTIRERRDVIEKPLTDELDISGWELRKALRLFRKSNPVFLEWIVSPYQYLKQGSFLEQINQLATTYCSDITRAYHYMNMAESQFEKYIYGKEQVSLKKYLYVLRPLLNLMWLKKHGGLIPMQFPEVCNGVDLPNEVRCDIDKLVKQKQASGEIDKGDRIDSIDQFVTEHLELLKEYCAEAKANIAPVDEVDDFFRKLIAEAWKQ